MDFSQTLLIQFVIRVWYFSHGNRSKTALRACSSSGVSIPQVIRWPRAMGAEKYSGWGAVTMSEHIQKSCRVGAAGARGCTSFEFAHTCGESVEILFHLCKSSRKISKCFCDVRIHPGHPIRNRRNLRDLRFKVYKLWEKSIELSIRCAPRAGAHTVEVGTRAMRRSKIRRSELHRWVRNRCARCINNTRLVNKELWNTWSDAATMLTWTEIDLEPQWIRIHQWPLSRSKSISQFLRKLRSPEMILIKS